MTCSTNTCGVGGWSGPLPGDPDNNLILSATPAFGGIDVSWNYPATNPEAVAYVKLYRGLLNNFNSAIEIAVVGGNTYFDKSSNNLAITYFYWIEMVSVNGTVGSLIGPASAMARPTIEAMIEKLTGQIDAGVLAQSLKAQIDRIELNAQAIVSESQARATADGAYSTLMTQVQAGVASLYSTVQTEITTRQAGDSTLASAINTVQSSFGTNLASVQQTLQSNIKTVGDKVTQIGALYTVNTTVNGLVGGFGIYNDGTHIEAGFDVDTFWVGKTGTNKKKPFIIYDGETFIDTAAIRNASIDQAKIGDLSAEKITTGALSASRINGLGLIIYSGNYTSSYSWPWASGGTSGFHLGPSGLLMGDVYANKYIQLTSDGAMYGPGFNMSNGNLTLSNVTITRSTRIAGGTFTIPSPLYSSDNGDGTWSIGASSNLGFTAAPGEFFIDTGYDDYTSITDTTRPVYTAKVIGSTGYIWYGGSGPGNAKTGDWAMESSVISDIDFYRTAASGAVPGGRLFIRVRVFGSRNNHSSIYQARLDTVTWSMNKVT